MNQIKYQRGTPDHTIPVVFTASRQSALKAKQDGMLAEIGKTYAECFSIDTAQFGKDLVDTVNAKIQELINWDALMGILVNAGCPEPVALMQIEKAMGSINLTEGLNEAVRAYGVVQNDLPEDFWGAEAVSTEPVNVEAVDVDLSNI